MEIRRAENRDAEKINELLYQVAKIHAEGRPDLFKSASKKYSDEELLQIIACDETPIFVAVEKGAVIGYAFCIERITKNNRLLQDKKTLYIDDLCVDENARGTRVGTSLYQFVVEYAKANGFDDITLNVWAFNEGAYAFYEKLGMTRQKIVMEKTLK